MQRAPDIGGAQLQQGVWVLGVALMRCLIQARDVLQAVQVFEHNLEGVHHHILQGRMADDGITQLHGRHARCVICE